jgi:hypothetical protein
MMFRVPVSSRRLVLLFAAALLWTQMLGLAHAVLHGPQVLVSPPGAAALEAGGAQALRSGWLDQLLGHAEQQGAPDCQLWDQLGHTAGLADVPVLLLPAAPLFFQAPAPVPRIAQDLLAPYGARAPPLLA